MNKHYKKTLTTLVLLAALLLPLGANAQYYKGSLLKDDPTADWNQQGLMNNRDNITIWTATNGIQNDPFGAPLGSGIAILIAAGAGYAVVRRKGSRKNTMLLLACVALMGFAQCKKEEPLEPQGEQVRITLNVNNGNNNSKADVNPPYVTFATGDQILVVSDGHYVGTLTHNGTNFSGNITDPVVDKPLYFYFLGNKMDVTTLTAGASGSTSCTVNISDQTSELPVISMAPSDQNYPSIGNTYTASLHNKCSLMKFNVTTPSNSPICITGMNNKVTIDFTKAANDGENNGFTYSKDGDGIIKMIGGSGSPAEKWAIVLPQDELTEGALGTAYTTDNIYEGARPAMAAISANEYLNTGVAVSVNTYTELGTPLTFEAKNAGATVALINNSDIPEIYIEYSTDDGASWDQYWKFGEGIPLVNVGDKVSFRGDDNDSFCSTTTKYCKFTCTDDCYIYGNIMSIIDEDDYGTNKTLTSSYALYGLFYQNDKIYNHPTKPLQLPATTLTDYCYRNMFYGCTNLTTAPALPATSLATGCYANMFNGCSGLTTAPELPATNLANFCYVSMFNGCTSLTTAPALPATTLAQSCYSEMFEGCTGLTTAPALPAATLVSSCYYQMFQGCTSLTTAPVLSATNLANFCYQSMFNGCTSLTTAPALPATTLANSCYLSMFNGCTSLTTAPALSATTLANSCYENMFKNCTSLTMAPALHALTLKTKCYYQMFQGCTSLTTAPALSATTLADYCCQSMFEGCTSLTTSPDLPASTLVTGCYCRMFNGCSSLNSIKCLAAGYSNVIYTEDWVSGVAATGTFYKASGSVWDLHSSSGIPDGWTVKVAQ